MTKEQIGEFIRKERKKQNLSQKELADKAGLSRYQQIMEVETGIINYGIDVLIKVIHALNFEIIINDPEWEQKPNKEVENIAFDFSKVESLNSQLKEKSDKKSPVVFNFKRKL